MVTGGLSPRQVLAQVQARLEAAGCPDADFDARELFRLAAGRDPHLSDQPLSPAEARRLEQFTARRAGREPLQYICGRWPFLNFELAVGPGVLCPRADTEVVAEAAAGQLKGVQNPRVLDLCAGTGCLGLGVKALRPDAEVTCLEKSPEALQYLRENARSALAGLPGQTQPAARVVEGDLFHLLADPAPRRSGPDCLQPALPHPGRKWPASSPRPPGSPPWPWPQGRMGWTFTVPWQTTTRPPSGPAGPWCWKSAGSSARPSPACLRPPDGPASSAARITAATTGASSPGPEQELGKTPQLTVVIPLICGIL